MGCASSTPADAAPTPAFDTTSTHGVDGRRRRKRLKPVTAAERADAERAVRMLVAVGPPAPVRRRARHVPPSSAPSAERYLAQSQSLNTSDSSQSLGRSGHTEHSGGGSTYLTVATDGDCGLGVAAK